MNAERKIKVAVIGGGCASIATAFELTRPEHGGRYEVTLYQQGWRLGGKGASGRGPSGRIEEHGLHLWLGYYENAFQLTRECYAELARDPAECPIADWRDAFFPDAHVALADRSPGGGWSSWVAHFPPIAGAPGDGLAESNPFTVRGYLVRTARLVVSLLGSVGESVGEGPPLGDEERRTTEAVLDAVERLVRYGQLATLAAVTQGAAILEAVVERLPVIPTSVALKLIDMVGAGARRRLDELVETSDEIRRVWEVLDLVLASMRGVIRFNLITDPRGFDAIEDYEMREWLRLNGASERTLDSAFVRGLYDLGFAFEDGDPSRPSIGAGVGIRGAVRMFYTYRGALFWKMKAGMGDVVFAPFYEVLAERGVKFEFFHRLENVALAAEDELAPGEEPWVAALDFDVQAHTAGGGRYEPLVDVGGVPSWPAEPLWEQLERGAELRERGVAFESHWDRHREAKKTLRVGEDFDLVVLGVSLGAIPHVCGEIVARDRRWQDMLRHVKTVATQAFQLWMREDMEELGWQGPPVNLSGFVQPFDTWADMRQLIELEEWAETPRSIAYFCSVLAAPDEANRRRRAHPRKMRERVRKNAVDFLERDIRHLWPDAVDAEGRFRWEVLIDARAAESDKSEPRGDERFDTQFHTANVNPTDRYVLSVPGSYRYRISPLDTTYDNLTVVGDWTNCGHNLGCVEAAVMSGRLGAHAISRRPRLEEIVGYDHP